MARLRRSEPNGAGLHRRRAGRGFFYVDADGRRVTDIETLDRIRGLTIPPAWEEVWVCLDPFGHIQAVGTDAKGRRQYRYHDLWRVRRDLEKFDHVLDVAAALPRVRRRCAEHLMGEGFGRDRVLATAVRLLDIGFFRIGGERYVEENGSYGLATLLKRHVKVRGDHVVFDYPAKSGRERIQSVADEEVRHVIAGLKRRRGGGPELLAYREGRRWIDVTSSDINGFLRCLSGLDVTAKDFRTWNATVLASVALAVSWQAEASARTQDRAIRRAIGEVSTYLGNTPAVCRSSYVDPRVIDLYRDGVTIRSALDRLGQGSTAGGLSTHGAVEKAVLRMLKQQGSRTRRAPGPRASTGARAA